MCCDLNSHMSEFAAGIVTYNPEIELLLRNIESIRKQVDALVVVDNASQNIEIIEKSIVSFDNLILIKNPTNLGVATALNQIITSFSGTYSWVILLDQDSVVPLNMINEYTKFTDKDQIGIICPRVMYENGKAYSSQNNSNFEYVDKCITSGSAVNIPICLELNLFDEKMFIDFVDFEYCARLRKSGYKIVRLNSVPLYHQLGNLEAGKFFGKTIYFTNHSARRYYYYTRNSLYYANKHAGYVSRKLVISKIMRKAVKILLFEKEKLKKIKAIFIGAIDSRKM